MYADNLNPLASRQRNSMVETALACTAEAMAGVEKVIELNVQTVRTSLSEQQALADATLAARSMSDAIDLQSQQLPATIKKTFAYWRHMEEIVVQTRLGVFAAMNERFGDSLNLWAGMVDATTGAASAAADQMQAAGEKVLVAGQEDAATKPSEAVAIVDSAGRVVSSDGTGGELH